MSDDKKLMEPNEIELEAGELNESLPAPSDPELSAGDQSSLPAPSVPETTSEKRENASIPPISIEIGTEAGQDSVMATQAIINRQAERLDTLKETVKQINDSLRSILENDQELGQVEDELKQATKKLKERKIQLTQSPESVQFKYKLKEVKEQIKELEESLNNHLLNYYQLTGTRVFDTDSGEQREFRVIAKIMGKKRPQEE